MVCDVAFHLLNLSSQATVWLLMYSVASEAEVQSVERKIKYNRRNMVKVLPTKQTHERPVFH